MQSTCYRLFTIGEILNKLFNFTRPQISSLFLTLVMRIRLDEKYKAFPQFLTEEANNWKLLCLFPNESIRNSKLFWVCVYAGAYLPNYLLQKNHVLFRNALTARTCVSIANKNIFSLKNLFWSSVWKWMFCIWVVKLQNIFAKCFCKNTHPFLRILP